MPPSSPLEQNHRHWSQCREHVLHVFISRTCRITFFQGTSSRKDKDRKEKDRDRDKERRKDRDKDKSGDKKRKDDGESCKIILRSF